MRHVFISYSHHDIAYARALVKSLNQQGFQTWIDEHINPGERWFREITQAIMECAAIIVIMTPEAEKSEWVEREILLAKREKKPIFPLLLRGREFSLLITSQFVDATDDSLPPSTFYEELRKVAGKLNNLVDEEFLSSLEMRLSSNLSNPCGDLQALARAEIHNHKYSWLEYPLRQSPLSLKVPCPGLNWRILNRGPNREAFLQQLKLEFLRNFGDKLDQWRLYAIADHAEDFCRYAEIQPAFSRHSAKFSVDDEDEIVLFDTVFNTGEALHTALDMLPMNHTRPYQFIFLFYNDCIPPHHQKKRWPELSQLNYLFRLSDTFKLWNSDEEVLAALRIVQHAMYSQSDIDDALVKQAIGTIRVISGYDPSQ